MADVILIYPQGGSISSFTSKRLPLGLLAISAILDKEHYKIKIIDQNVEKDWKNILISELKKGPICVGLSCATSKQILYAIKTSKLIKEHSNIPVVWGGVHPSTLPKQTLENPYIDIIVNGEGDIAFYELVKALEKNKELKEIPGLYFKDKNKIKKSPNRNLISNLDELPKMPFHLVNLKEYASVNYIEGPSIDLITSRGCPFGCKFCYNLYFNKQQWRGHSMKRSLEYVKYMVEEKGIKNIHFVDDNMGGNQKHLINFIKNISKESFDLAWGTNGLRVNNISLMKNEELKALEKSGCKELGIGVESGSKNILKMINKGLVPEQVTKANQRVSNLDMAIKYTFMIGFPGETKKEIKETIDFALKLVKENKNAWTGIFVYMPYPGTPLYEKAIDYGFKPPTNLYDWSKFNSVDSWHNHFGTWMSKKMIDYTNSIAFLSLLYNKNIRYKITNKLTRLFFDLYQPIAKFRLENDFHKLPIEMKVNKFLEARKND